MAKFGEFVVVQFTDTRPNPAFTDRVVPYRWHLVVRASAVAQEQTRWPGVAVTILPYTGDTVSKKKKAAKATAVVATQATIIDPQGEGFKDKITPKQPGTTLHLLQCPNCGHGHFRHAGYVEMLVPWVATRGKEMGVESVHVKVCVKCRKPWCWKEGQLWDLSQHVDVDAWAKAEVELQRATGPGGDC